METKIFSDSGEWTCPKCGEKAKGPKCLKCRFCIYAGLWPRILSTTADKAVLFLMGLLFTFSRSYSKGHFWTVSILGYLLYRLYSIGCVAVWGQTPGKALAKIKVVNLDGSPISWGRSLLRNSVESILSLWFLVLEIQTINRIPMGEFLGLEVSKRAEFIFNHLPPAASDIDLMLKVFVYSEFVVIFLNKRKRAIHDYIAGTLVIHDPRLSFIPWRAKTPLGPKQP
jgi:uncharacterized RDD family membrane protein YckC